MVPLPPGGRLSLVALSPININLHIQILICRGVGDTLKRRAGAICLQMRSRRDKQFKIDVGGSTKVLPYEFEIAKNPSTVINLTIV